MELCGTHVVGLIKEYTCPLSTTLYFCLSKKSYNILRKLLDMPFLSNLNKTISCQTLSKAFDTSRKTPLAR